MTKYDVCVIDVDCVDYIPLDEYLEMSIEKRSDIRKNIKEIKNGVVWYTFDELVHVTNTIEEASKWIGCTRDALYKSLHLNGVMKAKGYIIELVAREEV